MEIVDHSVNNEFNNDNKTQAIFQPTFMFHIEHSLQNNQLNKITACILYSCLFILPLYIYNIIVIVNKFIDTTLTVIGLATTFCPNLSASSCAIQLAKDPALLF